MIEVSLGIKPHPGSSMLVSWDVTFHMSEASGADNC